MHDRKTPSTHTLRRQSQSQSQEPRHAVPTPPVSTPPTDDSSDGTTGNAFSRLPPALQRAVAEEGYTTPTPIQEQAIPHLLAGRDLLGCAQTGTGKTAAFVLPILKHLDADTSHAANGRPRALILAPTRELAAQVNDSIATYGRHLRLTSTVIFGGVSQGPQEKVLRRGVDIVVATPGRLLDLMQQGLISMASVRILVLDEADRMLDMGFLPDIRRILAKLPRERQSLFFSATLPPEIVRLSGTIVRNPIHITVTPEQPAVELITQKVLFVDKDNKIPLLGDLLRDPAIDKTIVFTQMKHMANRVVEKLDKVGVSAAAIHGNKSQSARTRALDGFRAGRTRVLVATDIAARGIDVEGISHVINYDLPKEPETYVHRIGRTARAGADGAAISFCCAEERDFLRDIERLLRQSVPSDREHTYHSESARLATGAAARPAPRSQRPSRSSRQGGARASSGRQSYARQRR